MRRLEPVTITRYESAEGISREKVTTAYLRGLDMQGLCVRGRLVVDIQPNLFNPSVEVTIRARIVPKKEF